MKKAALLVCLLGGMAFASTKSFTVTLFEPAMVGNTQLKAGDYKFEVQNDKLVIMQHGQEATETNVKVETAAHKFGSTAVSYATANGTTKVEEVEVGGTHMRLVLN
jgi:hypothetical protein